MTTLQPATRDASGGTQVPVKVGEPAGFWSIERAVALATPVFAAAGGYVFTLLGKVVPDVNLSRGQFTALFISGAVAALTAALTWLRGRQSFVHFVQGADHVEKLIGDSVAKNFPQTVPELRQIEAALESHEDAIIDGVAHRVGMTPSAEDVAKQIVAALWPQTQPTSSIQQTGPTVGQQ